MVFSFSPYSQIGQLVFYFLINSGNANITRIINTRDIADLRLLRFYDFFEVFSDVAILVAQD